MAPVVSLAYASRSGQAAHPMEPDEVACPFCAETIKGAAIKCKHCGEMLSTPTPTPVAARFLCPSCDEALTPRGACMSTASTSTSTTRIGVCLAGLHPLVPLRVRASG